MITKPYFENIQAHIANELRLAQRSILLAVAWLTDTYLYQILLEKVNQNLKVQLILIDDEINKGSFGLNFSEFLEKGGSIVWVDSNSETLMHNKFCIIDTKNVITGSYNWTNKAQQNDENITITKDSTEFAVDFVIAFNNLLKKYGKIEIPYVRVNTKKIWNNDIETRLIPFRKENKWGFSNIKRKIIIPCIYEDVHPFQGEYAAVKSNNGWGVINRHGQIILPLQFSNICFNENFNFIIASNLKE